MILFTKPSLFLTSNVEKILTFPGSKVKQKRAFPAGSQKSAPFKKDAPKETFQKISLALRE